MRFNQYGPDIPDALIRARDEGRVVFFCGAGISIPAGYPSFMDLTYNVMKSLGVSDTLAGRLSEHKLRIDEKVLSEKTGNLAFSLDETFYLLQQEYGVEAVENQIFKELRIKKQPKISNHEVILRLSQNQDQEPQVVTTNFDLLFEKACKGIRTYCPPSLPDVAGGHSLDGVVYLHGRWNNPNLSSSGMNKLIIGSADFGRAYLADGWASRFVKSLTDYYVIVLLGYSAEDPPVRYLLEGLHTRGSSAEIYAFDKGSKESVHQNWQHKGVTGIAFDDFPDLWEGLTAWAEYVENPSSWVDEALELARQDPTKLSGYQRYVVSQLASTEYGAKSFCSMSPPAPIEWLFVFDSELRNQKISSKSNPVNEYDGSKIFGYDERYYAHSDNDPSAPTVNLLGALFNDRFAELERPYLFYSQYVSEALPSRLRYLAVWLCKHLNNPLLLWWACNKQKLSYRLSSMLMNQIEDELNRSKGNISAKAQNLWRIFLESQPVLTADATGYQWHKFQDKYKALGWCAFLLRELERVCTPYLLLENYTTVTVPPLAEPSFEYIVRVDLKVPHLPIQEPLVVGSEYLPAVCRVLFCNLSRLVVLAKEVEFFSFPSVWSVVDDSDYADEIGWFLQHYLAVFRQLAEVEPNQAKAEIQTWPSDEFSLFGQLRLYLYESVNIFEYGDVEHFLVNLSDDLLWDYDSRPTLLNLWVKYWGCFDNSAKSSLLQRISLGPTRLDWHSDVEHDRYFMYCVAGMLGYLSRNGCTLNEDTDVQLNKLRMHQEWAEEIELLAATRRATNVNFLDEQSTENVLQTLPVSQVIRAAKELANSNRAYNKHTKAFSQLVKSRPVKAFTALIHEAKQGRFDAVLWASLLSYLPEDAQLKLRLQVARRTIQLPAKDIAELTHQLTSLLKDISDYSISSKLLGLQLAIWDMAFSKLKLVDESSLRSVRSSESSYIASYEQAYLAPMGKMALILIKFYSSCDSTPTRNQILKRMVELLNKAGAGKEHVVCIFLKNLSQIFKKKPGWVKQHLVPFLKLENPYTGSAWHGLAFDRPLPKSIFNLVQTDLTVLFDHTKSINYPFVSKVGAGFYTHALWYFAKGYISHANARKMLQATDTAGRLSILNSLLQLLRNNKTAWLGFSAEFFSRVWPKELKYRHTSTSGKLLDFIGYLGISDRAIWDWIVPLLSEVIRCDTFLHQLKKIDDIDFDLATKVVSVLAVVIGEQTYRPYNWVAFLDRVASEHPEIAKNKHWLKLKAI